MLRTLWFFLFALLIGIGVQPADANVGDPLRPNLQALPASDIRLEASGTQTLLRFSTITVNVGTGPLELRAGPTVGSSQKVYQRIYLEGGGFEERVAGDFEYHPTHGHFHFEDYANYVLQPVDAPGASQRTGTKTTFCIMDTTRYNTRLSGAPKKAFYTTCGSQVQGMSVGWGDKYGYWLPDQWIDVTGLPDDTYVLRIIVDPLNRLAETSDDDNVSELRIQLGGGTVTVLDGPKGRRG